MHCTLPLTKLPRFKPTNITLETATIARRNLTKVPSNAFQTLAIRHLDLSGNALTTGISSGAFRGLSYHLESLSLAHCFLPKVPYLAFHEIPNLKVLHLEYNDINELRARSFLGCPKLKDLSLYRNNIKKIERNAFEGLNELEKLRLSYNGLKDIRRKMFVGMGNMTSLDISDNKIKRLRSGAFRDMGLLKWLELGGNDVAYLNRNNFRGLRKLKYLKLDRNPIMRLQDRTFVATQRLRYLSLDIENITLITNQTFKGLSQLKTFYIGEVNRPLLPDGVFSDTIRLKFLSLSDFGNKFYGLHRRHFGEKMNMKELSIWMVPMHQCSCHIPWIMDITSFGAYVHGYCPDNTPISCKRRHKRKGKNRRRDKEV